MQLIADVKCYHCGHISGQVEGTREERLVIHAFKPREGFKGTRPGPGEQLRCERCTGPVYLEDLRPMPAAPLSVVLPAAQKRKSPGKAA